MATPSFKFRVTRQLDSLIRQRALLIKNNASKNSITLDQVLLLKNEMLQKESDLGIANFFIKYYGIISQLPRPRTKTVTEIQKFMNEARNLILK